MKLDDMNSSSHCSQFWPRHNMASSANEYVLYSAAIIFCLIGIFGNIVNVLVLQSQQLKASTYTYLASLATLQATFLVMHLVRFVDMIYGKNYLTSQPCYIAYVIWPISSYASTTSVLFTVGFTIDRYIFLVVRRQRRHMMTDGDSRQRIARLTSVAICVISGAFNWPRMLAFAVDHSAGCTIDRWSLAPGTWFHAYSVARFCLFNVGSILLLIVFNSLLICQVTKSFTLRRNDGSLTMNKTSSSPPVMSAYLSVRRSSSRASISNAKSLTFTLIFTVCITLLGEIPIMLFNPLSSVLWTSLAVDVELLHTLSQIGLFLMLIENSGTFFIYVLVDAKFRQELNRFFIPDRSNITTTNNNNNDPFADDHLRGALS